MNARLDTPKAAVFLHNKQFSDYNGGTGRAFPAFCCLARTQVAIEHFGGLSLTFADQIC